MAGNWTQVELTRGQLDASVRLNEFPDGHIFTMKDRLYCDNGTVYLGTSLDDGVRIPPYLVHHFSYDDVARTLSRLIHLREARGWTWDSVWSADDLSVPLAMAIANLFDLKFHASNGSRTLVVQAIGESVSVMQGAMEEAHGVNSFCLLTCWAEEWHADITGVITPLPGSVPWFRKGSSSGAGSNDHRPPERIAQDILTRLDALLPEPNLTAQLDYYYRHQRLRWEP